MSTETQQLQTTARIPAFFGGLTSKQSNFIDNYLGLNDANRPADDKLVGHGGKSAFAAGYGGDLNIASVRASQLLRVRKIQEEIKRRLGTAIAQPPEILERLSKQARADITDLLDKDGQFDLKLAKRKRLLKKLKVKTRTDKDGNTTVEQEYEIHDPQSADDKLGKWHKMWSEQTPNVQINLTIERTELTCVLQQALEVES